LEPLAGGGIGLAVVEVAPQSPAWKSGFRVGDRLIGIGGEAVTTIDRFADSLQSFGPGVPIKFLVQRQGRSVNLTAILQDRALAQRIQGNLLEPNTRRPAVPYQPISGSLVQEGGMVLGVSVSNLSEAFRQQFGIPVYRGASVSEVVVGSPAELAGIRPGDCIVEIDGRMVLFAEDVVEATRATSPGQSMVIGFYRGLQKMRVEVPVLSDAGPDIQRDDIASRSREDLEEEIARLHEELDAMRRRVQELESRLPAARR
jgi:S1-C subfamily serine protease